MSEQVGLDEVQVCYQAASLLLSYPDEQLLERLPVLREALAGTRWAGHFAPTLAHLEDRSLAEAQSFHVQEFDISRRHALHLSYWTDGDTRRRGEVLAGIKQVYRDSGLLVRLDGELPDHLPLVLEFAALGDPQRGHELLVRYRPSLELLRMQLETDELPQAGILQAICATLPGASPSSRAEVQQMVDAAIPVETVGLDGYGGAGFDRLGMGGDPATGPQFVELEPAGTPLRSWKDQ
ncbi:nitrate reductase molybdenum cofactor assembly chaperone [Luteococcus peritonei]|uniref:Nitrate reductase molybdenum cofactor assembly chaperone n=1 Tax=Luteococcus peritonei TaxID=88874 RepID=A0ABW4RU76_9ACTN